MKEKTTTTLRTTQAPTGIEPKRKKTVDMTSLKKKRSKWARPTLTTYLTRKSVHAGAGVPTDGSAFFYS